MGALDHQAVRITLEPARRAAQHLGAGGLIGFLFSTKLHSFLARRLHCVSLWCARRRRPRAPQPALCAPPRPAPPRRAPDGRGRSVGDSGGGGDSGCDSGGGGITPHAPRKRGGWGSIARHRGPPHLPSRLSPHPAPRTVAAAAAAALLPVAQALTLLPPPSPVHRYGRQPLHRHRCLHLPRYQA